jgi:hypothetical protein
MSGYQDNSPEAIQVRARDAWAATRAKDLAADHRRRSSASRMIAGSITARDNKPMEPKSVRAWRDEGRKSQFG